jgi:hypothetical protein
MIPRYPKTASEKPIIFAAKVRPCVPGLCQPRAAFLASVVVVAKAGSPFELAHDPAARKRFAILHSLGVPIDRVGPAVHYHRPSWAGRFVDHHGQRCGRGMGRPEGPEAMHEPSEAPCRRRGPGRSGPPIPPASGPSGAERVMQGWLGLASVTSLVVGLGFPLRPG